MTKFEQWFSAQNFYTNMRFIHGDGLFCKDGDVYRVLPVQMTYVAWNVEPKLGEVNGGKGVVQITENNAERIAIDEFGGGARTIRVKCTKCGHYLTGCYCYSDVRHDD